MDKQELFLVTLALGCFKDRLRFLSMSVDCSKFFRNRSLSGLIRQRNLKFIGVEQHLNRLFLSGGDFLGFSWALLDLLVKLLGALKELEESSLLAFSILCLFKVRVISLKATG